MGAGTRRRFAPSAAWSLAALAGLALFIALGLWQLDRADEKRARLETFNAAGARVAEFPGGLQPVARFQHLRLRGRYEPARQFLLDNMTHQGRAGFRVLTPLRLEDGRVVIVDRGFIPGSGDRSRPPELSVSSDLREVTGRADELPRPGIELAAPMAEGWPRIVGFPHIDQLQEALGEATFPQLLLLDPDQPDGYIRDWQPPVMAAERHLGYAVQWFGFALVVVVIWVLLSFRHEETST